MARKIDPAIDKIISTYGLNARDVLWDCHGKWCMYHWAVERVAASQEIIFQPPRTIYANLPEKCVALEITGRMGDKIEWSTGEAAPYNCKNAYPAAMAEKRGKDRVVLKLIGLHGLVYSEDEIDAKPNGNVSAHTISSDVSDAKAIADDIITQAKVAADDIIAQVNVCKTEADIDAVGKQTRHIYDALPKDQQARVFRVGQEQRVNIRLNTQGEA